MALSIGIMPALSAFAVAPLLFTSVAAHIAFWHPSMYGFNVTTQTFPYDNRPVIPLAGMTFDQWWFHGHISYPPHKEDVFELPVGQTVTAELACDKGATFWYASSPGGDIRQGDWPCPNQPSTQFHTINEADTKGCALAIAPVPDVNDVKPEDFVVFSVNQNCVWNRFTTFDVPADMPACPEGGCHCAWFWVHDYKSGSEQNYMNGFQCNVTGARPDAPAIGKAQLPRRCGADPEHGVPNATPSNCTDGPKSPFYWYQKEGNNMFEGTYAPPYYNDLYDFKEGAQNDIFETSGKLNAPTPLTPTPASSSNNSSLDSLGSKGSSSNTSSADGSGPNTSSPNISNSNNSSLDSFSSKGSGSNTSSADGSRPNGSTPSPNGSTPNGSSPNSPSPNLSSAKGSSAKGSSAKGSSAKGSSVKGSSPNTSSPNISSDGPPPAPGSDSGLPSNGTTRASSRAPPLHQPPANTTSTTTTTTSPKCRQRPASSKRKRTHARRSRARVLGLT